MPPVTGLGTSQQVLVTLTFQANENSGQAEDVLYHHRGRQLRGDGLQDRQRDVVGEASVSHTRSSVRPVLTVWTMQVLLVVPLPICTKSSLSVEERGGMGSDSGET